MNWNILRRFASIFLVVLLIASPAEANAMIPLVGFTWIGMVFALVPVIVVETLILWTRVGLPLGHAAGVVTVANLASTLIGIPIACLLLVLPRRGKRVDYGKRIQWWKFNTVMRDWLWFGPRRDYHPKNKKLLMWAGAAAGLALSTALFAVSFVSEFWVASFMVDEFLSRNLSDGVFLANLVSYGILFSLIAGVAAWDSVVRRVTRRVRKQIQEREKDRAALLAIMTLIAGEVGDAANTHAHYGISRLKNAEARIAERRLFPIKGQASVVGNSLGAHENEDYSQDEETIEERRAAAGG